MFEIHRNIFGNVRKIVGNFSEIRVMWIRKSQAFYQEKVGRYTMTFLNPVNGEWDVAAQKLNSSLQCITASSSSSSCV